MPFPCSGAGRAGSARVAALVASALLPTAASALPLDFEEFVHGEVVMNSQGVVIITNNFKKTFDLGVAFDTSRINTADPDLEGPPLTDWAGGNLAPDVALGKILIIQENRTGCADFVCNLPDDEGGRPPGSFEIRLPGPVLAFGFDVVDIEGLVEQGTITFYEGPLSKTVDFIDLTTPGNVFYDPTVQFGNHTANRIRPFTARSLGLSLIDRVIIVMGGSGGVDNLTAATVVPEPGAAALLGGVALGALALVRRARRAA